MKAYFLIQIINIRPCKTYKLIKIYYPTKNGDNFYLIDIRKLKFSALLISGNPLQVVPMSYFILIAGLLLK